MGYRSTIRYSTSKEGFDYLMSEVEQVNASLGLKHPLVGTDLQGNTHAFDAREDLPNGVVFGFDDVKWYSYFEDVAAFSSCIENLDAMGFPWICVRIGEDFDDIETDSGNNGYEQDIPQLTPVTAIDWY